MKKKTGWIAAAAAAVLVAGCASSGTKAGMEPGGDGEVVMCSKCQSVWVTRPHQVGKVTVYRREKVMECPDCDSAVMNFFKTGKFAHTCKTCGDNLAACPLCK